MVSKRIEGRIVREGTVRFWGRPMTPGALPITEAFDEGTNATPLST